MTDSNEQLRQFMFAEIQKRRAQPSGSSHQASVLGAFVEAALTNTGRTRADFARAMDMDEDVVDMLLDGELPEALLRDRTLVDMARLIDYDANVLRAMLGRPINPSPRDDPAQNLT